MYFDRLRFFYRTTCRPFRDSDREVTIRWVRAAADAKAFPYPTPFNSLVWRYDHQAPLGPGPGESSERRQWVRTAELPYGGQRVLGDPRWYIEGLPVEALEGLPPDGRPCSRPASRAGLVLGARGLPGFPGFQRGAAGLLWGARGEQTSGPEEAGRAGLLWGAQGLERIGLTQLGGAGLVLGAQGLQYAAPLQLGGAGLQLGAAGIGRIGLTQLGGAGLHLGAAGIGGEILLFCQVHQVTHQSFLNNATAAFVWDTVDYDPSGLWAGVGQPTRFVAPLTGLYSFYLQLIWNAGLGPIAMFTYKNGTFVEGTRSEQNGSQVQTGLKHFQYLKLTAGDYVELELQQSTGVTQTPEYSFGAGTLPQCQVVFHGSVP